MGFSGTLSGENRSPSIIVYRGVELAVEEWNSRGGIVGREIILHVEDDQGTAEIARKNAESLVALDPAGVVGFTTSSAAAAALEIMNRAQLVCISPTASSDLLKGRDDHFFTMYTGNRELSAEASRFAREDLQARSIIALYDEANGAYTKNYLQGFRQRFEDDTHHIIDTISFNSADQETSPGWDRIGRQIGQEKRAEAVLIIASSTDTGMIMQQLYKRGLTLPIIGCDWGANGELISQGGPLVEHFFFADISYREDDNKIDSFIRRFQRRYGTPPDMGAVMGYESADLLFQALEKKKGRDRLKEILLNNTFITISGEISFTDTGDARRKVVMKKVKGDTFAEVER